MELDLIVALFEDIQPEQYAAAGVALLVTILIFYFARKSRQNYLQLPELPTMKGDAWDTTVVIPARNEAANIQRVVTSFPLNRVIVADDDSNDRTAELAMAAGAEVITPPPLKKGHAGKPNACLAGAAHAETEWVLFVDADTWYKPEFLPSLVEYVRSEKLSMATVFLHQECVTVWERMILPYAFGLYFCGVDADMVQGPDESEALANGQCMLWKRSAYEFVGGHGAVAKSVIEDVELARVAKRHTLKIRVMRGEKLGSVRMYDGFGAIWRGFQKNAFRFLVVNPATGRQVVMASIVMTSWLPVWIGLMMTGLSIPALLFYFVPVIALTPWYGGFLRALLAPFGIYLFQLIALNAMITTTFGRSTSWKGRPV